MLTAFEGMERIEKITKYIEVLEKVAFDSDFEEELLELKDELKEELFSLVNLMNSVKLVSEE